jgi:hypothetical protein
MPQQQLHRSQVAGLFVNLRRFRPPQRVGAINRAIETGSLDPAMDDASVLPCREVQLVAGAAREEELTAPWRAIAKPIKIAARVCSVISNWTGRPVFR